MAGICLLELFANISIWFYLPQYVDRPKLTYQPQVGLKNGSLYGVEALARWRHPTLGDISPARFVPLAEECGLIGDLGDWAVREACSQLAIWRNNGLRVPSVSVNLSATNFHNLNLPRMIAATLAEFGLAASDLMLETVSYTHLLRS